MQTEPLNKRYPAKANPNGRRQQQVVEFEGPEGRTETWRQCSRCRSLVHVAYRGATTCACGRLHRWRVPTDPSIAHVPDP